MLMDIDNFKRINDLYGHYCGDMVLKDFSDLIQKQLRAYDLFGRFGGEEFIALFPGANEKEAIEVAERLRQTIENSTVDTKNNVKYTVSIGLVTLGYYFDLGGHRFFSKFDEVNNLWKKYLEIVLEKDPDYRESTIKINTLIIL